MGELKTTSKGTDYIEEFGEIKLKRCRDCLVMKELGYFYNSNRCLGGKQSRCKECNLKRQRSNGYKENQKRYNRNNRGRLNASNVRRRARKQSLVNSFKNDQSEELYNSPCILTNTTKSIDAEHFIALSTGHGGSYMANLYSLEHTLNISKSDRNPYEWVTTQDGELQERFYNDLVPSIADAHGLTTEQLERFTYYCYDNPREIDEAMNDDRPSLQIWAEENNEELSDKALLLIEEQRENLATRDFEKIRYYIEKEQGILEEATV